LTPSLLHHQEDSSIVVQLYRFGCVSGKHSGQEEAHPTRIKANNNIIKAINLSIITFLTPKSRLQRTTNPVKHQVPGQLKNNGFPKGQPLA